MSAILRRTCTLAVLLGAASAGHAGGCNSECPADLDFSGAVDGADLGALLGDWGQVDSCANLDGSAGGVDGADLGLLLGSWGPCRGSCVGTEDCCSVHASSGCNDATCCAMVCAVDPACCTTAWDESCVEAAVLQCAVCLSCPGTGDCCTAHESTGCDDEACCDLVCQTVAGCCDIAWDEACALAAQKNCSVCGPACPGEGDCCAVHETAGCSDAECCDSVCFTDPSCCETAWDQECVDSAIGVCGACMVDCPGAGDCCTANGSPGCNDSTCCTTVCLVTPECCELLWDQACADMAIQMCDTCMPACPALGDCCAVHATAGCSDAECCNSVCFTDPTCCEITWDQQCVDAATRVCDACTADCPGTGDCCVPNGTPGCSDTDCCETICAAMPECCQTLWDQACADFAQQSCDTCTNPCPGAGDCCSTHLNPGCDDADCCESVCFTDLSCCEEAWDQACVNIAESVCDCP